MLRDRYENDKFFMEIVELTSKMDPVMSQIDKILEDDELYQQVRNDFSKRYPGTLQTGRSSSPVEVVLRMLVVKHLYGWSYARTEQHVRDSLVLRLFCRVYFEDVPDEKTLLRWAHQIQTDTLKALNERVTKLAQELKITRGRKLRTDGTVVESNVRYPTDSGLLVDGVRVLGRTLTRAKQVLATAGGLAGTVFRNRSRSARKQALMIANQARKRSVSAKEKLKQSYRQLVKTTEKTVQQAKTVLEDLKASTREPAHRLSQRLAETIETFLPRVEQVLKQTKRRVFQNESVPASEKLVSLFEVDTAIIRRNKAGKPTEFGRKVWLDEVDGGIISDWRLLDGNPSDDTQRSRVCDSTRWHPAIDNHCRTFGKPPVQASADRGVYSSANENYARQKGVRHVVLPKAGYKSQERHAHEKQAWFKRGRRFHAGVEGRTPSRTGTGLGQCSQTQTCLRHLSLSWQSGLPSLDWLDHSGC